MKHMSDIAKFVKNGDYETTDEGILIHRAILARGFYIHSVNGKDEQIDQNLVPTQGINYLLNCGLGSTAKEASWFLALFNGGAVPAAGWTAANFAASASEITSTTEGYTETTRQAWTPTAATTGTIGNVATKAVFTIAATTTVTITGAGLLSASARGGITGVLASASRFATSRIVNSGDIFELGYTVTLTDS